MCKYGLMVINHYLKKLGTLFCIVLNKYLSLYGQFKNCSKQLKDEL